jgi:hypothetical protein
MMLVVAEVDNVVEERLLFRSHLGVLVVLAVLVFIFLRKSKLVFSRLQSLLLARDDTSVPFIVSRHGRRKH